MPRVHSVSEIKVMLSGILGSHAELKNIKVRGKIFITQEHLSSQ